MSRGARHALLAIPVLLLTLSACSRNTEFPSRPVTLICPWSAGGGTDRVARNIAAQLEEELGVPVNVVNATGGAGVTGHTRGALARPDGYTITLATAELNMLHWRGLTSITYRDYDPLMLVNRDDAALFVRTQAPWKTLDDLQQAIEARPRELKASGTAQGGIWHVSLAGWLNAAGQDTSDVIWISINGAAPSLQELMAGGVDMVCCSMPEAQTLLDAGEVRCLGVMSEQRLTAAPDVPTLTEQGIPWALGTWRGLVLPNGVPEARKTRLVEAVGKVANGQEYLDFMKSSGFNPAAEPPEEFAVTLEKLDKRFGDILTSEAFKGVQDSTLGPLAFPGLLGILLAAVGVALAARGMLRRSSDAESVGRGGAWRIALVAGWIALFVLFAETGGFLLTAGVLLLLLLRGLGARWHVAAAVTVVLVPAVYALFAMQLRVPLPWGVWGT